MKYFLFFCLLPVTLNAQFNIQKEKYWIYRERVKNYVVSDNCDGCGTPPYSRSITNRLNYNDTPWMIGYWIGNLAMEYRLLSQAGADLTQTKKDLFYALEAINRIDYKAELSWGCGSPSLNGFMLRDDVPENFTSEVVNGETVADLLNESLVPPPDGYRALCMNSNYAVRLQPGSEASLDHMVGLYIGLTLVKACVPPSATYNNTPFAYEPTTVTSFVEEVQNISHRIITWFTSHGWIYWNPCVNRCVYGVANPANPDNACVPADEVNVQPCSPLTCCSDGGALAQPSAIGFAAVNKYIQTGNILYSLFADALFNILISAPAYQSAWDVAISLPGPKGRLATTLAALGNVWRFFTLPNGSVMGATGKQIAKKLVKRGEKHYWEHLILLHRLLHGTFYKSNGDPIIIPDAHYECLLDAAHCRGYDGKKSANNIEWGWTDRLDGGRCDVVAYPHCDYDADARIDFMFYFNLFNNVTPQGSFTPLQIKNLAPYDIVKPDVDGQVVGNYLTLPYNEYDKKNFIASHNITAHDYIVNYLPSGPEAGRGRVTFAAGNKIILQDGFKVINGGYFHGYIDPTITAMSCIPPSNTDCDFTFKTSFADDEEETDDFDTVLVLQDSLQYQNPQPPLPSPSTSAITIHPNPSEGRFNVQMSQYANVQITIYNVLGEVVYKMENGRGMMENGKTSSTLTLTSTSTLIDISNHPKGIYFVKVQSAEQISVHKVIYQ